MTPKLRGGSDEARTSSVKRELLTIEPPSEKEVRNAMVMHISSLQLSEDDLRVGGLHIRTMISVLQVFVISLVLGSKYMFTFLVGMIKRDRQRFVLVDIKHDSVDALNVEQGVDDCHSESVSISKCHTEVPSTNTEQTNFNAPAAEQLSTVIQNNIAAVDSLSRHTDTASNLSIESELRLSIVFDNSTSLDIYVMYISLVGVVLWQTFLSFNFSTYNTC